MSQERPGAVTLKGGPLTLVGPELKVGDQAPDFAVVDKDLTASLLAFELDADRLLLLTDVAGVYRHWPDRSGGPIRTTTPEELSSQTFDPGSMGPKVEAACEFVRRTGQTAVIGALQDAPAALRGEAGTQIRRG